MAHILLVDDYRPIRFALARYLRLYGHSVTEVANVRTALEKVDERIDVVVTALTMRGRGGSELLRALHDRGTIAPVIIMSGRFPHPSETTGAAFVLYRPFEPRELLEAVDQVLHTTRSVGSAVISA